MFPYITKWDSLNFSYCNCGVLVYENPIYNIYRFVLQESGILLEGVWLWRICGGHRRWRDRNASRHSRDNPKRASLVYWCFNSRSKSFIHYWQKTVAEMLSLVCSLPLFVHDPPVCGQCIVTSLQPPVQLHVVPAAVGHQISMSRQPRSPVASQLSVNALSDIMFCANTTLFWYALCPPPDTETEQSPVP